MLELLETKIDKKRDEIIPQQWIFLSNINIEIENNGNVKGYMKINHKGDIFYDKMILINRNCTFDTKINTFTDKLYVIGDMDFTEYNIMSTMAYIIGNTQPFTQKLSLEAEIQLQRIELKNNKIFRVYMKKYGQAKIHTNSDPIYGEDEITIFETNPIIEMKGLKQNTLNVVKVIKLFGNEKSELSEATTKLVLGLYTNAVLNTVGQTLERVIARNWRIFQ